MKKNFTAASCIVLFLMHTSLLEARENVPQLNSYPAAASVIFLDFDGQTVSGTEWNINGDFECAPAGLSPENIIVLFNRVAEDYRPFTINITTDSARYWAAPLESRTRVIITTSSDWYGVAGGVAFTNSFSWGTDTPCFVFSQLLNFNVKNIAEACSHEAGHTLGLWHQSLYDGNCNRITEYNPGAGTGEIGWAPIMGNSYGQNLTLWHNGPNQFTCSQPQNDLSILTSNATVQFRADDFDDDFNNASIIPFVNSRFAIDGIIERPGDRDLFRFAISQPGRFTLTASPYHIGDGNLAADVDIELNLYAGNRALLGRYNPPGLLSTAVDTFLDAGNYYLEVQGTGNQYAPDYASLGSYTLAGAFSNEVILPVQSLVLAGSIGNGGHELRWTIISDEPVVQQEVQMADDGIHFSTRAVLDGSPRAGNWQPSYIGRNYYRIKAITAGRHEYFSNIIWLTNGEKNNKPIIAGNPVRNGLLQTSTATDYHYSIYNSGGQLILRGTVQAGFTTIQLPGGQTGVYHIRFTNNNETNTLSFMRL